MYISRYDMAGTDSVSLSTGSIRPGQRAALDMMCTVYNLWLGVTSIMIIMIFCCSDGYNVEAKETLQMRYKGGWIII